MRRFLVPLLILAAAFPATALSERGDGTLAVRDGRGKVTLVVKGSIVGRFANGSVTISELEDDGSDPVVRGYERVKWGRANAPTYSGKSVRFRLIGGRYRVQFAGKGLHLSAVGRGRVLLHGNGSVEEGVFYDGFYSLNGAEEDSLPDEPTWLQLSAEPPPPPE